MTREAASRWHEWVQSDTLLLHGEGLHVYHHCHSHASLFSSRRRLTCLSIIANRKHLGNPDRQIKQVTGGCRVHSTSCDKGSCCSSFFAWRRLTCLSIIANRHFKKRDACDDETCKPSPCQKKTRKKGVLPARLVPCLCGTLPPREGGLHDRWSDCTDSCHDEAASLVSCGPDNPLSVNICLGHGEGLHVYQSLPIAGSNPPDDKGNFLRFRPNPTGCGHS